MKKWRLHSEAVKRERAKQTFVGGLMEKSQATARHQTRGRATGENFPSQARGRPHLSLSIIRATPFSHNTVCFFCLLYFLSLPRAVGFIIIRQRLFVAATSASLLCSFTEKHEGTVDNAYATCGAALQRVVEGGVYPDLGIAAGPRRGGDELDCLPFSCPPVESLRQM